MKRAMNGFLALVIRELNEQRLVFAVAALLAVVASVLPVIAPSQTAPEDLRVATATALGIGLALLLALVFGIAGLPEELSSGVQSFYFAHPIPAQVIWASKVASALILALGGGLIAAVPAASALRDFPLSRILYLGALASTAVLFVFGLSYFASLSFRARGPWMAFDLAWILAASLAGYLSYSALAGMQAADVWQSLLAERTLILVPGLLLASAIQVVHGRSDLARGHRAMSLVLGLLVLILTASLAFASLRVLHPRPEDLRGIESARFAPRDWLFVRGFPAKPSRRHNATFLWKPDADRFVHLGVTAGQAVSESASRMAWLDISGGSDSPPSLRWADLSQSRPVPRPSPVTLANRSQLCCLSPDGRLVAWHEGNRLLVAEIESGEPVWSHTIDEGHLLQYGFDDSDSLFMVRRTSSWPKLMSFAIESHRLDRSDVQTVHTEPVADSPSGVQFIGPMRLLAGGHVFDAATGARIADLGDDGNMSVELLTDGRIAVFTPFSRTETAAESVLEVFNAEGKLLKTLKVPESTVTLFGGQLGTGELVLVASTSGWNAKRWHTFVLDAASGAIRPLTHADRPVVVPSLHLGDTTGRLFADSRGALLLRDSEEGFRQLTRGGSPWRSLRYQSNSGRWGLWISSE